MDNIVIIYHCDEWQSRDSFRTIGVVKEADTASALKRIQKETGYTDEEMSKYIFLEKTKLGELDI